MPETGRVSIGQSQVTWREMGERGAHQLHLGGSLRLSSRCLSSPELGQQAEFLGSLPARGL